MLSLVEKPWLRIGDTVGTLSVTPSESGVLDTNVESFAAQLGQKLRQLLRQPLRFLPWAGGWWVG